LNDEEKVLEAATKLVYVLSEDSDGFNVDTPEIIDEAVETVGLPKETAHPIMVRSFGMFVGHMEKEAMEIAEKYGLSDEEINRGRENLNYLLKFLNRLEININRFKMFFSTFDFVFFRWS